MIVVQVRASTLLLLAAISLDSRLAAACRCRAVRRRGVFARRDGRRRRGPGGATARGDSGRGPEVSSAPGLEGDAPAILDVVTATDCAYSVRPGEKHLLFLLRAGEAFTTGKCMGDTPSNRSQASLAWLRRHGKPAATAGRVP